MFHHLIKIAFLLNQLPRRTLLLNLTLMHHDHLIVVSYCDQPVSYGDHSRVLEFLFDDLLDKSIGSHVDVGCGLVEYQKFVSF